MARRVDARSATWWRRRLPALARLALRHPWVVFGDRSSPRSGAASARTGRPGSRLPWVGLAAGFGLVALIGVFNPLAAAGGTGADRSLASAGGTGWSLGLGGLDFVDLAAKSGMVLALLFICLRVLGRLQSPARRPDSLIEVLESRPLAAKASLHLVAVGERRLILGLTPNGMVALGELSASELPDLVGDRAAPELRREGALGRVPELRPGAVPGLASLMAPVDTLTARIAGLLGGGRAR